jgi:hypothetical protein
VTPEAVSADPISPARVAAGWADLRRPPSDAVLDEVIERVEAGLRTAVDRAGLLRKRRSVGARSARGTWVRIEARPVAKLVEQGQPPDGLEAALLLDGVATPRWLGGVSWPDPARGLVWRADEIELITAAPIRSRGPIPADLELSSGWWQTMNTSLDNLARQRTTRIATPDTEPITQELVTATIQPVFGSDLDTRAGGGVDLTVTDHSWTVAHADLNWSNITAPECWLLDWEDHGLAPRGLDAATLWIDSLGVEWLAERVYHERRADLNSRPGRVMTLMQCAKVLADPSAPARIAQRTRAVADEVLTQLRA